MKLTVDKNKCQGHAMCHAVAPSMFPIDDDGYVAIDSIDVPADQEELAQQGVDICPERAITLES